MPGRHPIPTNMQRGGPAAGADRDGNFPLNCDRMKPGQYDRKHPFPITGAELREWKRHTEDLPQSFGLDNRLQRYQGTRPIGLYRWDLEYVLDVLSMALENTDLYPSQQSQGYLALQAVHDRFKKAYESAYRKTV